MLVSALLFYRKVWRKQVKKTHEGQGITNILQ